MIRLEIIKNINIFIIFCICLIIGKQLAKKYKNRVYELEELKIALNIFKTKLKFTYEPLPEIFKDISEKISNTCIKNIFIIALEKMQELSAEKAWEEAILENVDDLNKEDKNIIKTLSKLLGQLDIEGQISRIEITEELLEKQIENAINEKQKNEKLYRTIRRNNRVSYNDIINIKNKEDKIMEIDLLFKIAAIGILVAVLHQVLVRAGREDQAMMTTLAGLVIVLTMVIKEISILFDVVRTLFDL